MSEVETFKVRRLTEGCCGMENGRIYEATGSMDHYVRVKLPNGEWTSDHWAPGHFKLLSAERFTEITKGDNE